VSVAYAQQPGAAPAAAPFASILPLIMVVAIFYLLVFRPEQRKRQEHTQMVQGLKRNDKVTMNGGLRGRVVAVTDTTVTVEIAPKVQVDFDRSAVERVHLPEAREKERGKA
jgi:preprotein translocase subunit YajC